MADYMEFVKKARDLHKELGENEFRKRYENHPAELMGDMGYRAMYGRSRGLLGRRVLQAFEFYPMHPNAQLIYDNILQNILQNKRETSREALKALVSKPQYASHALHILEARGLIRLKKERGRIFVREIFHEGVWKKAVA